MSNRVLPGVPKVSIGLPVYNGQARLGRALDSVLCQEFTDFELIISDNASTDDTKALCEAYAEKDRRIRYFRNETNIGINPNHDRVFELSKGRYFAWFADDVEYLPGMLGKCVDAIEQAPANVVMVYPRCEMIWDGQKEEVDRGRSIASADPRPYKRLETVIRNIIMVNQLYGLIRREALPKTQLNGLYASSDYVLVGELAMLGEIREIAETLIRRRIDPDRGTASVYRDAKALRRWSGAGSARLKEALLSNRERLALEYLHAALRSPIRQADKLMCLMCVLPTYYGRTSRTIRVALRLTRPWTWRWKWVPGRGTRHTAGASGEATGRAGGGLRTVDDDSVNDKGPDATASVRHARL